MMNSTLETDKSFFIKGIARFNWMFLFLYAAFPLIALEFLEWAASGRLSYYSKDSQSLSFAPAFGLIVFIAALNYLLSYWVQTSLPSFKRPSYGSTASYFYLNLLLFCAMFFVPRLSVIFLILSLLCASIILMAPSRIKLIFILPGFLLCAFLFAGDFKMLIIIMIFLVLIYSHDQKLGVMKLSAVSLMAVCSFLFLKADALGLYSEGIRTNDFIHSGLNCLDAKSLDANKQLEYFINETLYALNPLISAFGLEEYRFSSKMLDLLKERHGFLNFETAAYNFGILAQFCYFDIQYWFAITLVTASSLAMSFWVVKIFHLDRMMMLGVYLLGILNLYRSGFGMFISFLALVLICQIVSKFIYDVLPKRRRLK